MRRNILALVFTALCFNVNATAKWATLLTQSWTSGNWQNQSFSTYSYDGSNNLTSVNGQSWAITGNSWTTVSLITYTNNPDGTPQYYVSQSWAVGNTDQPNLGIGQLAKPKQNHLQL